MSERALVRTAVLLGALLALTLGLTAHRLGYFRTFELPSFEFHNPLLTAHRGQRVNVRPLFQGAPQARWMAAVTIVEPQAADRNEMFPAPHIRASIEERDAEIGRWHYRGVRAFPLAALGFMKTDEWLEELALVEEQAADGTRAFVVRARCGNREGARVDYYYDPEAPVPMVGWYRREMYRQQPPPEVYFAAGGGMVELPAAD